MTKKDRVIAIAGPTASGKTSLAVSLAKELDGEIISADSRQIYKEFNIAAAKPSIEERGGVVHHLIDIVAPNEEYTVANFSEDARKLIKNITERGKTPIIAGGTGLYFRTLLQDFDIPQVEPNKELREELNLLAKNEGTEKVYQMLKSLDPDIAKKIHPNNTVKIIRSIEVSKALNIPMSKAQGKKEPPYDTIWLGLNAPNREFLYERINLRVEQMVTQGLEEEARRLFEKYGKLKILMSTIGYEEFWNHIYGEQTLDETISLIQQNTRRYAKRQLTWFRQNQDINWFDIEIENEKNILRKCIQITT